MVEFRNPTRIHSLKEEVTCSIYKEDEVVPILNITKSVKVPPSTDGQYIFPFTITEPGEYTYSIVSEGEILTDNSQILLVEEI